MRFSLLSVLLFAFPSCAQWQMQDAHTNADLRGIDSLGGGVAWASGSNGTVLRTEDAGFVWQLCAVPPGAAHLDFRGIQAFDNNIAVVMSSGKGDLSRIYKTTDGCQTWKRVFDNPEATGFFDAIHRVTAHQIFVAGDPVRGKFSMYASRDAGDTWFEEDDPGLDAPATAGAFAASNSSLANLGPLMLLGTGGPRAAVYRVEPSCDAKTGSCGMAWKVSETPLAHGDAAAGVFSLGAHFAAGVSGKVSGAVVAVGGNYSKPAETAGSSAFSVDGGATWTASVTMPGGYRSAVGYDKARNRWIAVGPNGTDVSTDDGRNWRALKPDVTAGDTPDTDQRWNALSLPFVVGPHGRIGVLRPEALSGGKP